jgi:predicted O-methyltransferase YrrM
MNNIAKLLECLKELTPKGVTYPDKLLAKHNPNVEFDKEVLKYLVQGGVAGAYYHWLTLLAQHSDAKTIVELGNRYGTSTIALFHGMKEDQKLITVDIEKDQRYVPSEIFESPQVQFVYGDCLDLSVYEKIPLEIDILFTDTIHFYDQIRAEYLVYEPLLAVRLLL